MGHYQKMEQSLSLMVYSHSRCPMFAFSMYYIIIRGALLEPHAISRFRVCYLENRYARSVIFSCIDVYAHSCLKPFSIGRKPCSNSKTHVQIMKFTCRLNMGFGRRHWSMRRDVMCFVETKWPTLKKLRGFWSVFTLLMLFS